jgi:hypothetical protein
MVLEFSVKNPLKRKISTSLIGTNLELKLSYVCLTWLRSDVQKTQKEGVLGCA